MRTVNTAAMIATTLFEDVPQMAFLATFVMYMDLFSTDSVVTPSTKRFAALSFAMSAFGLLPPSTKSSGDFASTQHRHRQHRLEMQKKGAA